MEDPPSLPKPQPGTLIAACRAPRIFSQLEHKAEVFHATVIFTGRCIECCLVHFAAALFLQESLGPDLEVELVFPFGFIDSKLSCMIDRFQVAGALPLGLLNVAYRAFTPAVHVGRRGGSGRGG